MKSESSNHQTRLKRKSVELYMKEFEHEDILQLNYELGLIKWGLRVTGMWPFFNRFSNIKFFIFFVILSGNIYCCTSGILYVKDIEQFLQCFLYFVVISATILKYSIIMHKRRSIKFIFKCIINDCSEYPYLKLSCKNRVTNNIKMRKLMSLTIALLLLASVGAYMTITYIIYRNNLNTLRELPLFATFPKFIIHSQIFYFVLFGGVLGLFLSIIITITVDSLFAILMIHATNQFIILSEEIKTYNEEQFGACYKLRDNTHNCKCMRCIINKHVDILRFVEEVDKTFYVLLSVEMTKNLFHFALQMHNLIWLFNINNVFSIIHIVVILFSVNSHLFMYCVTSANMTEAGQQIGHRVFRMKWYNLQITTVKNILLMMKRSQKPCYITVAKFINLSLQTYTSILIRSISYASVIIIVKGRVVDEM